ncbi:MAG: hypothetical protein COU33_03985 [Candidatus Magasanikbacteria bacterium CG10_big_fil_rev_8_21_14_0_10_43_6]|uniref:Uncharacterized protein n=1 Tax=Candidatus Magasanikbacteria bacterium CG10_big_fil_rev_8_21_14_0_10_43_6 TaxID=1974650 RepID=A0A2M6W0G5_9BACT|nr:MAG: hypothetical protein COU33_03985 [Candidatus Magasanikbacteria bacterium CG10_big_fil_rev_8_21_14_0_10_43_6]
MGLWQGGHTTSLWRTSRGKTLERLLRKAATDLNTLSRIEAQIKEIDSAAERATQVALAEARMRLDGANRRLKRRM